MQQVSFRRMDEGTPADYALLNRLEDQFVAALPDRILASLKDLEHSLLAIRSAASNTRYNLQRALNVMVLILK